MLPSPCFMKIDVDGFELDVLEGARTLLQERKVRLLIETHSKQLEQGCQSILMRLGHRTRVVTNAWWRKGPLGNLCISLATMYNAPQLMVEVVW